jgi:hypothetical protein
MSKSGVELGSLLSSKPKLLKSDNIAENILKFNIEILTVVTSILVSSLGH